MPFRRSAGRSWARQLLFPAAVPNDWRVEAVAEEDSFAVVFTASGGARVLFAIAAADPPLAQPETTQAYLTFRAVPRTYYQVMNRYDVRSPRQLMWVEPGTWAETQHLGGPIYFLTSIGLTDEEFWRIANSLEPIQP